MSVEYLVLVVFILGIFLLFAAMTYGVLLPLRLMLRLGPRGGVDVGVSLVFAVFLLFLWATASNARSTGSWILLLALPVCLAGLLFLGVGLFEAPTRAGGRERRDRVIVGSALIGTAFVIVQLGVEPYQGLFSDVASSVSGAPGP